MSERSQPRWIFLTEKGKDAKVVEVNDCMECIHGPGDYGWVSPVNRADYVGIRGMVIAHFEHLFATREAAVAARIDTLKEKIAVYQAELERHEAKEQPK